MFLPRTVDACLVERFIFNFRVRPEVLTAHLPVAFLRPQVFHGWSVVSFCVLQLEHVILAPLPSWLGLKTVSSAYRCGVLDTSGDRPVPSVYILTRSTDHSLLASLGPQIFASALSRMHFSLIRDGAARTIRIHDGRQCLFAASIHPSASPDALDSQAFASLDAFADFMSLGITSYTPAMYPGALARVDLQECDTRYTALTARVEQSSLANLLGNAEVPFDSALQATGGRYKWIYRGLVVGRTAACMS
jgi:hypothetical protein